MEIVKIRRVGNSNVVSLPRSLEAQGYVAGIQVLVDTLPTGEVILRPERLVRERMRELGREVIAENRTALDILTAYDRGDSAEQPRRHRTP